MKDFFSDEKIIVAAGILAAAIIEVAILALQEKKRA